MDRQGLREAEIELQQLYEKIRQKDEMMKKVIGQQLQGKGLQRWPAAAAAAEKVGSASSTSRSLTFTSASSDESGNHNEDTLPSLKEMEASLPTVEQQQQQQQQQHALPSMKPLSLPSVIVSSMMT
ncbi:hypothetical protein E4U16_000859 [Claviceps sp. LM84 group G4]|nr:hypothetical protein E4U16_000859 [Claviceps sp. LM84 group G4]